MKKGITKGSGNVFKDLGYANPSERLFKSKLARQIDKAITQQKLTQVQAAKLFGTSQAVISNIKRGVVKNITIDRLVRFLHILEFDVEVKVIKRRKTRTLKRKKVAA
jgi:predicted XRE-type DNA-binding protein